MQGKLLINKPGQIPCGLINSTATVNNHLPQQQQQQQPQHLNHHHQQQNHNGLTYSVSVNTATNRNLMNNNRNLNDNHKKLDRSISEPVEKIILQAPTLNNKYLLQTATIPPPPQQQQQQQSHHNRQRQQQQHTTILATNTSTTPTNIIMKSSTNSNNSSNSNNSLNSNNTTSSRYKTELCRPFEENGTCKYGDKCQFAHGYHELRNLQRHPRYKTVLCRTFHTVGFCPYGPRCHFIHNSEETKKSIIHTLQTGGPNIINVEKMTADHSTPSSSPTSSRMLDNLSPSTPTSLLMDASAILNGAFVNNNATTAIGFIANLQQQAQKQLQNGNSTTATGMRPKALSIGSSSLDGSSTSGDLSQPSTPPSGSPASLTSCFDQVPNPFDDSIINNLINSNNQANGDHSAFTYRDTLSLCEQKFLSLSLSPLINY